MAETSREQAKRVILQIVAIAGGRLEGVARLNKAFYAAHIIFWRDRQGLLTDYPVVKLPNGPGIDQFAGLIYELVEVGDLEKIEEAKGPYTQSTLVLKVPVEIDPNAPEFEPISEAVRWVNSMSTAQLSVVTHEQPSYQGQPRMGYEQAIYLDALSEDEYEGVRAACNQADEAFRIALGA
jgi:hypothetical protein